jgi:hypothetical protein
MAIRDKFRKNAQEHLEAGEQIQAVFGGQSHSAWLMVVTGVIPFAFFNRYYAIAVTDRRIIVAKASIWSVTKFKEVVDTLPRTTRIGPPSGLWWKSESLGRRIYVHKRFHGDVQEADRTISVGLAPAPQPEGPPSGPPAA